jgi:hypothetical protein
LHAPLANKFANKFTEETINKICLGMQIYNHLNWKKKHINKILPKLSFSHTSRLALGPTQPPVQWVPGLSGGKAAEA